VAHKRPGAVPDTPPPLMSSSLQTAGMDDSSGAPRVMDAHKEAEAPGARGARAPPAVGGEPCAVKDCTKVLLAGSRAKRCLLHLGLKMKANTKDCATFMKKHPELIEEVDYPGAFAGLEEVLAHAITPSVMEAWVSLESERTRAAKKARTERVAAESARAATEAALAATEAAHTLALAEARSEAARDVAAAREAAHAESTALAGALAESSALAEALARSVSAAESRVVAAEALLASITGKLKDITSSVTCAEQ